MGPKRQTSIWRQLSFHLRPGALWCCGLILSSAALTSRAYAETTTKEKADAEALFAEGRRLMAAQRYAEACAKFRESQLLDSGVGTLLNLGRCYAKQGKTASAWSTYGEAAALARAAGQHKREEVARNEIDALEPELSRIRIRVATQPGNTELRVTLDGMPIGRQLWGIETPIDPGDHELAASAPGFRAWSERFQARERTLQIVQVPALAPLPSDWTAQHTVAVVEAGVGLAALALGGYLVLAAHSDYDAGGEYCETETRCSQRGVDLRERAITKARFAGISFVVGGAALAGAGVLWFSAPSLDSKNTRARRNADPRRAAWSVGFRSAW
jgi:tetratricopeptide (TPR) repeat protein